MKADQMSAHLQPLPTSHVHDVTPHFPHITGMRFTTSSTSSIIIWAHSGHLSSPWCFPQATITSFPSGKATQSCFPVAGPTSHLKMTRPPGFFFFFFLETKVERKWCTNSKMHCWGWGLGTRLQNADTCVLRSQNTEAWRAKTMSAGCVNTVVACWKLITFDCTSQEN